MTETSSILRDHALANLWQESVQDHQYRIKPNRLSPNLGFSKTGNLLWTYTTMPNANDVTNHDTFHLYALGQLQPLIYSLALNTEQWYPLDTLCVSTGVVVDVVAGNGAIIPRHICYLKQTRSNDLVLAVTRTTLDFGNQSVVNSYEETITVPYTLDRNAITVRFYHNAITSDSVWRASKQYPDQVLVHTHKVINSQMDYNNFITNITSLVTPLGNTGLGNYYLDGFLINQPSGYSATFLGKTLSFWYDQTIREKLIFPIANLTSFKSTIDNGADKYLLLSTGDYDNKIDFNDDLDFYLVINDPVLGYKGVMLDRYRTGAVRQVTQNAWSVRGDVIRDLVNQNSFISAIEYAQIIVVVRDGGRRMDPGYQNNRIDDLTKLTYNQRINALTGSNSTVDFWKASVLENSDWIKVMSSKAGVITNEMVESAYGYHAATKAVMRSLYTVNGASIEVDPGFCVSLSVKNPNATIASTYRTVFWYNHNGKLLGYSTANTTASTIYVPDLYVGDCAYAEVFLGKLQAETGYSGNFKTPDTVVDNNYGYYGMRHYVCSLVDGVPDYKWTDVTNDGYVSLISTNPPTYQWNQTVVNNGNYYWATRFADTISVREYTLTPSSIDGTLSFDLDEITDNVFQQIGLAPGHIDVFMNGEPLIRDLEYYYRAGGTILITRQLGDGITEADIVVRWYGFLDPDTGMPFKPRDIGFVKGGIVSVNNHYNPVHSRPVRVNVAGRLFTADQVNFEEDMSSTNLLTDGFPYAIEDYQPGIEHFTSQSTIEYLKASMANDVIVGDYLTGKVPLQTTNDPYVNGLEWPLYSPIMATFITMMSTGALTDENIAEWINDTAVSENTIAIVNALKDVDPVIVGYDKQYCYVAPYPFREPLQVTSNQYSVLETINRIHLDNTLDLSRYLTIK